MLSFVALSIVFFSSFLLADDSQQYRQITLKCIHDGESFLTFDGGPSSNSTGKLLEILKKENITGGFFFTWKNLEGNSGIAQQAISNGHLIGYRMESDWNVTAMSDEGLYNSIERRLDSIKKKIGKRPKFIRDNMEGEKAMILTDAVLTKLRYAGYGLVGSLVDGKDGNLTKIGKYPEPWQGVQTDLAKVSRSDSPIIRLHDTNWLTVNQTKNIIDQVRSKGIKFVNFSQCFGIGNGYFEDSKKISPFYGDLPKLGTPPEDQGKIFSNQQMNSASSTGSNLLFSLFAIILTLL